MQIPSFTISHFLVLRNPFFEKKHWTKPCKLCYNIGREKET